MSEEKLRFPGVFIRCAGCFGEIPADENDGPPERPFRCRSCRARHMDAIRATYANPNEGQDNGGKGKQPDGDSADNASPARSTRKRDREVQPTADQ